MAGYQTKFADTYVASSDLSAKQYRIMKISGDGRCTVCTAITDKPIGILQDNPLAEMGGLVMQSGVSKVIAGGTLAAGDLFATDANGAAVAVVPGTDTTRYICGHVRIGAASGAIAEVVFDCMAPARAA